MNSLNDALRQFDATEANLVKLENLWKKIKALIPEGIQFRNEVGDNSYDDYRRSFGDILRELPSIDGWSIPEKTFDLNEIAQMRLDAWDVGMIEYTVSTEEAFFEQEKYIREYRYKFSKKRRQLVRDKIFQTFDTIDIVLKKLNLQFPEGAGNFLPVDNQKEWQQLKDATVLLDTLLGSIINRPAKWNDLQRHLHFGLVNDLNNIISHDWPKIKESLFQSLYDDFEAIPIQMKDIGEIAASKPTGDVTTALFWENLTPSDFERLIFCLISNAPGYENPEWLMHTNASDKGRDLSVTRILTDSLGGIERKRVIIQCKHWLSKSIAQRHISETKEQMCLWEPPRVDILIIATTSRFTADAVSYVEKHNQSNSALRIEMWPESHLERLLASRPSLIAEFRLREKDIAKTQA